MVLLDQQQLLSLVEVLLLLVVVLSQALILESMKVMYHLIQWMNH